MKIKSGQTIDSIVWSDIEDFCNTHLHDDFKKLVLTEKLNSNNNELFVVADELNPNDSHGDTYEVGQYFGFQDGFEAGYDYAVEQAFSIKNPGLD